MDADPTCKMLAPPLFQRLGFREPNEEHDVDRIKCNINYSSPTKHRFLLSSRDLPEASRISYEHLPYYRFDSPTYNHV